MRTFSKIHGAFLQEQCIRRKPFTELGLETQNLNIDRSHTLSMVLQGGLKQCEGPEPRGLGWVGLGWVGPGCRAAEAPAGVGTMEKKLTPGPDPGEAETARGVKQ